MKSRSLWKISVTTSPEAEAAVAELLEELFGQSPAIYFNARTGATVVTSYCPNQTALTSANRAALVVGLARIKQCGLCPGSGRISVCRIKLEDWAESWKRHFKPLEFGRVLLIKPSWSKRRPRKNQALVLIDPGLSFGTGQHPTTAFCLQQLVVCPYPAQTQSFLDIGTGSGILAIAAAKLGYEPVHAFDLDPEAVRIARANACRNGVEHKLRISLRDLTKLPHQSRTRYDIICANLTANLLLAQQRRILNRLQRDGTLVLAGILRTEFAHIHRACNEAGLKLVASRTQREWRAGAFRFAR